MTASDDRPHGPSSPVQRAFGRGRMEGLSLAGIPNPEKFMTARKLAIAAQGLNGIALKVYNAVPIAEEWTLGQICAEMARIGSKPGVPLIEGSVRKCVELGLVKCHRLEGKTDAFQRVDTGESENVLADALHRAAEATPESALALAVRRTAEPALELVPPTGTAEASMPLLERLAELGNRARYLARENLTLADAIDAIAIDVDEELKRTDKNADKLRAFKALFADL